mgnify:CR=1 FL=1
MPKALPASAARARRLWKKYRITPEQYDKMVRRQGGVCAICKRAPKTKPLEVDHDHSSGKVRGLLDWHCNRYLLMPRHTPRVLRRAADYLESKFDGRSLRPRRKVVP